MTSRENVAPKLQMRRLRLRRETGCKGHTSNEQRSQGTSQHPSDSRALPNPQQGLSYQPCNQPVSHQEWISKIEASCRKSGCQATNMTQCVKRETVHLTTIPWAYISHLIFTIVVSPQGFQISYRNNKLDRCFPHWIGPWFDCNCVCTRCQNNRPINQTPLANTVERENKQRRSSQWDDPVEDWIWLVNSPHWPADSVLSGHLKALGRLIWTIWINQSYWQDLSVAPTFSTVKD